MAQAPAVAMTNASWPVPMPEATADAVGTMGVTHAMMDGVPDSNAGNERRYA